MGENKRFLTEPASASDAILTNVTYVTLVRLSTVEVDRHAVCITSLHTDC